MDSFQYSDYLEMDMPRSRADRSKPVKRKWREIEFYQDKQRLQRELIEMGFEAELEEIDL